MQRRGKKFQSKDKKASRESRGAFVFTDRSGKKHALGGRAEGGAASNDSSARNSSRSAQSPKKKFQKKERSQEDVQTLKGRIDKNRKGFAFLQFESRDYEDAFLSPDVAEKYFHGDRVEAVVNSSGEILELRVLEHRFREVVGRFYPMGQTGVVVYERKKAREDIPVVGPSKGAKTRDWVRAKMNFPADEFSPVTCTIEEVYGQELPSRADIQMVAAEYNLMEEHSSKAVAEAEAYTLDLKDTLRTDLRHIPFITIDGETARDFDDAVYVERTREGGFILWVAIADVSHYVKEGTALDEEAYARGTSVYFPERAFHMLPRALSENLCSLRPAVPRLTMTAKILYDREGNKKSVEVFNTIIESKRRATYTEIQAEADARPNDPNWEYRAHFDLYRILRRKRNDRGSIDFDLPEAEVRVDAEGEPISILHRPRKDAHRLIEEFMIAANESVTEWALERHWPFIYRVHEEPARQAMARFQELCSHYGIQFEARKQNLAFTLNEVVKKLEGHPAQFVLNTALLRSMAQAHYTSVHGEHFGLASVAYTHFTSPIRRYPDLVVHRMLKRAIESERKGEGLSVHEREEIEEGLVEASEHCSYRERIAADAERESIRLKQTRIMIKEVGNNFFGKVNGMNDNGMFIQIEEPFVEGFVPQEGLHDDFYSYDEKREQFVGRRSRKAFRVGDRIEVSVVRVDLDLRRVDLAVVSTPTHEGLSSAGNLKSPLKPKISGDQFVEKFAETRRGKRRERKKRR